LSSTDDKPQVMATFDEKVKAMQPLPTRGGGKPARKVRIENAEGSLRTIGV